MNKYNILAANIEGFVCGHKCNDCTCMHRKAWFSYEVGAMKRVQENGLDVFDLKPTAPRSYKGIMLLTCG